MARGATTAVVRPKPAVMLATNDRSVLAPLDWISPTAVRAARVAQSPRERVLGRALRLAWAALCAWFVDDD